MSKRAWEAGEIRIPAGAWPAFRKALLDEWNRQQQHVLALAEDAYETIRGASSPADAFDAWLRPPADRHPGAYRHAPYEAREHHGEAIARLLFRGDQASRQGVLKRPLEANLELRPGEGGGALSFNGASLAFDEAHRLVKWVVSDNDRAVERARQHPMAKAFFAALGQIAWSPGSGGDIVGNDAYHQDNLGLGGGENYVTESFGPRSTRGLTRPRRR